MTRMLAWSLDGLLEAELLGYWTEQAERNFMPSAAAQFPEAWVDTLDAEARRDLCADRAPPH